MGRKQEAPPDFTPQLDTDEGIPNDKTGRNGFTGLGEGEGRCSRWGAGASGGRKGSLCLWRRYPLLLTSVLHSPLPIDAPEREAAGRRNPTTLCLLRAACA